MPQFRGRGEAAGTSVESGTGWHRAASVLLWLGVLWSGLALLDPLRPWGRIVGPLLAAAGWLLARPRSAARAWLPLAFACTYAMGAMVGPELRADGTSYYAYLRSIAFDGDLDFANERAEWGLEAGTRTATGLTPSTQPVGPAVFWSPFFALAHAYVRLGLSARPYAADGFSPPYLRALALGTLTAVVLGAWALALTLSRRVGPRLAWLATLAAIASSPVLYYAFVVPAMAHGLTFALAAGLLWAWDRVRLTPSLRGWGLAGLFLGALVLCRWQGLVWALLLAPLAVRQLRRGAARPHWVLAGAGLALLVFAPQFLAWKILFGHTLTLPQGSAYVDWGAPHLSDVLISANHGLFTWTPAMALGLLGLFLGWRREPWLQGSALAVFAATAWVNGSVTDWDWAAGDAFGARRFDLVVPLLALGLARLLVWLAGLLRRQPLLAPAAALGLLALWNLGLIASFREGRYPDAAPLDAVAKDQARRLRRVLEGVFGFVGGPPGRALVYRVFSAEYLYTRFNRNGTFDLADADERWLGSGWAPFAGWRDEISFRWALYPRACIVVPLDAPLPLPATIEARAPRKALPQRLTVTMNGVAVGAFDLSSEWSAYRVTIPRERAVPGQNQLCLAFSNAAPGYEESGRVAAAVSTIRLR